MSKKKILLIGPQCTGKTCIIKILNGDAAPTEHIQTLEQKTIRKGGLVFTKKEITEIGSTQQIPERERKDGILCSDAIVFVFNGIEILNEMKNWQNGGETTSFLRNYFNFAMEKKFTKRIYFVATHKDQCNEMRSKILNYAEKANHEYVKFSGGSPRYNFYQEMAGGNLFPIDARDEKDVNDLYEIIVKQL